MVPTNTDGSTGGSMPPTRADNGNERPPLRSPPSTPPLQPLGMHRAGAVPRSGPGQRPESTSDARTSYCPHRPNAEWNYTTGRCHRGEGQGVPLGGRGLRTVEGVCDQQICAPLQAARIASTSTIRDSYQTTASSLSPVRKARTSNSRSQPFRRQLSVANGSLKAASAHCGRPPIVMAQSDQLLCRPNCRRGNNPAVASRHKGQVRAGPQAAYGPVAQGQSSHLRDGQATSMSLGALSQAQQYLAKVYNRQAQQLADKRFLVCGLWTVTLRRSGQARRASGPLRRNWMPSPSSAAANKPDGPAAGKSPAADLKRLTVTDLQLHRGR